MRQRILLAVVLMTALSTFGLDKKIEKFVGKYDVAYAAKNLPPHSPEKFWETAIEDNALLSKFNKNIEKGRGAEKEAWKKWKEIPRLYPQYDKSICRESQSYCDSILDVAGMNGLDIGCRLFVIDTDAVDLYTMLTDKGFAICMTKGLLSMEGVDDSVVMGFVAHEFVHGAYRHYLQKLYDDARKKRKDRLVGAMVGVGILATAVAVDALLPPDPYYPDGNIYYFEGDNTTINNYNQGPLKYAFRFSENQVLQADLVAFRFMENMGCAGAYLDGLKILSPVYDSRPKDTDNTVPMSRRINFIEYMTEYPGIGLD